MKVAVVDVGYNSLKMVKYRVEPDGFAKSYGQLGVMAKLGEGLEETGFLGEEPISRTVEAILICREAASLDSVRHVILVGTSPVREAANREEFLRRVRSHTGFDMRVLTGNEEALYGFLGGVKSVGAQNALFFDLGGGSLQMTYAEDYRIKKILSLPLGALRLSTRFARKQGTFSRKDRSRMSRLVSDSLPSRRELGIEDNTVLIGTGGTVRALARYDQELRDYPFNKLHHYVIEFESVQRMSREFFRLGLDQLNKIDAVGEGRSETIASGAFVVRMLMKNLGFERLTVSTHGLRDGILAEFVDRGIRPSTEMAPREEVESLLVRPNNPARLSGNSELLECFTKYGVLEERERRILLAAFERGRTADSFEADAESLFWTLMSEDLPMTHEDQLFMAISSIKARRPRTANWFMRKFGAMLLHDDSKSLKKMGACLRLMEVLDRSSARFKVAFSDGFRIVISESANPFPLELARASAEGLSVAIKKAVHIVAKNKTRNSNTESVKVRG